MKTKFNGYYWLSKIGQDMTMCYMTKNQIGDFNKQFQSLSNKPYNA